MLVFKGQPDGRVERRLNKNWFVKEKYLLIANRRFGAFRQQSKMD